MVAKARLLILIILISIIPTVLIWIPFFFRMEKVWGIPLAKEGMATIVANYDGPLFLVVAKTLYDKEAIKQNFSFNLPAEYYPAHFPLFPLLIRLIAPLTGFPYGMLLITTLSSIFAIYIFSKFIKEYVGERDALWFTLIFAIFPARWLIVRSVGSAEPLLLASIIASIYYFRRGSFLLAAIFGVVAQLTKSVGILLFFAYLLSHFWEKAQKLASSPHENWKTLKIFQFLPIFLIPLSALGLFYFYKIRTGDFLAYFNSGDNIHLFFPPFQIFNSSQAWVGTFWLEEVIFVYLFALLGISNLIKMKENVLAWFVGIFFVTTLFVSHRDIIRYSLPIVPFLYVAFAPAIAKKEFRILMAILAVPIYLFALTFISQNVMPISNWAPLL